MAEQQPPIRTGLLDFLEKVKDVSLLYLYTNVIIHGLLGKKLLNI